MQDEISFDRWLFPFAAFLIALCPLPWLLAALFAALIHELCHWSAVRLLGGRVTRLHIGPGGAVMETELSGWGKKLIAVLAGPAGSLSLMMLGRFFPRLAICGLIHGVFNLLPIQPLDGGCALRFVLERIAAKRAERLLICTEILLLVILMMVGAAGTFLGNLGMLPLFSVAVLILKTISRKRPCKPRQIGVQ